MGRCVLCGQKSPTGVNVNVVWLIIQIEEGAIQAQNLMAIATSENKADRMIKAKKKFDLTVGKTSRTYRKEHVFLNHVFGEKDMGHGRHNRVYKKGDRWLDEYVKS